MHHVPMVKLKYLADFNPPVPSGIRGSKETFPIFPMEKIISYGKLEATVDYRPVKELLTGYTYLEPTDVAYAKVTPYFENGKGILGSDLDGPSFATTELTVLRPKPGVDQRYLSYLLQTPEFMEKAISSMTGAGGLKRVSEEFVKQLKFPLPDLSKQQEIADALDRELSEIDGLIACQNQLLSLANEKFYSELISLCLPQEADYVPLKRFADVTLGKMKSPADKGSMILAPYIRAANIQPGGVFTYKSDAKKMWFTNDELQHLNLRKGDVLVVEGGAGFGRSAILTEDLEGWGFQTSINRVRVRKGLADPEFINFAIQALLLSGQLNLEINQSTIPHLTAEKLEKITIPNLNLSSQQDISNILFSKNGNVTILKNRICDSINKLKELKSAIIISGVN